MRLNKSVLPLLKSDPKNPERPGQVQYIRTLFEQIQGSLRMSTQVLTKSVSCYRNVATVNPFNVEVLHPAVISGKSSFESFEKRVSSPSSSFRNFSGNITIYRVTLP